jgi:DNA-binding LacI/PurR family transcriptional regulator
VPGTGVDFCPVGPWNADGLIVIPDDLSEVQFEYVHDLIRSGYPVVLTTAEKPGPLVAVDNAGGIRQALNHLLHHGHRRIAFIAGKSGRGGDSAERLSAYREALREAGIEEDARLIAFGEHRREDGRSAMRQILSTGAPFTALLASNDLSCFGAMEVLCAAGQRIPEDVAAIGIAALIRASLEVTWIQLSSAVRAKPVGEFGVRVLEDVDLDRSPVALVIPYSLARRTDRQ